jgi:hypothetical protein
MVAPIVLFDIPCASAARALLGQLPDSFETRFLLRLLIPFFAARGPVFELIARLAFMPCLLVDNANSVPACYTRENVAFDAAHVYLTRVTGPTPSKVSCPR